MSRPNQAEDLDALLLMRSLNDDVRQQAAAEILSGKPLATALRHARAQIKRDNQSCGFEHIDAATDDAPSLHDLIAAADPADLLDVRRSRSAIFTEHVENMLCLLADGTGPMSDFANLSQRMMQLAIIKTTQMLTMQGSLMSPEDRLELALSALLQKREGTTSGRKAKSAVVTQGAQGELFGGEV